MRNIVRLFVGDLKRLMRNTVTVIIVLGLVLLPSIFSWYNIIACWDVFGNTGGIKVAVANSDEGYESDLVPLKVNMGEQVVSELRANDQLEWVFTDEEDAVDGARSGDYYAAVVIPPSFSADMMTFFSDDVEHASIVYYTNEKVNAVAPKMTDQGADQVSTRMNRVFTETLSDVALTAATALSNYVDESGLEGRIGDVADRVGSLSGQLTQASGTVGVYASLLDSAQTLIDGSSQLIADAKGQMSDVGQAASGGSDAASTIGGALEEASSSLSDALSQTSESFGAVSDALDTSFAAADGFAGDAAARLRTQADKVDDQVAPLQQLSDRLGQLEGALPEGFGGALAQLQERIDGIVGLEQRLSDGLRSAADSVEAGNADAQAGRTEAQRLAEEARDAAAGLKADYDDELRPGLDELAGQVEQLSAALSTRTEQLSAVGDDLSGASGSVSSLMEGAQERLVAASDDLAEAGERLGTFSDRLTAALASGEFDQVRAVLGSDPSALATALAAPVGVDRQAVFPAESFGDQMAPLYTVLGVWIGSLLMLVAVKPGISDRARAALDNPKPHEIFLGHFGVFSVLSLLQTTVLSVGSLLFLGIQAVHPLLYVLCYGAMGIVFVFVIYTLTVSFANLGKAVAVVLLVLQVTAGGGSYPLAVLPPFFQALSPYLPATHAIAAVRAAMMGIYQGDYWVQMGLLLLFLVPFALIGLVLRRPLMRFMERFMERVDRSKLVA